MSLSLFLFLSLSLLLTHSLPHILNSYRTQSVSLSHLPNIHFTLFTSLSLTFTFTNNFYLLDSYILILSQTHSIYFFNNSFFLTLSHACTHTHTHFIALLKILTHFPRLLSIAIFFSLQILSFKCICHSTSFIL